MNLAQTQAVLVLIERVAGSFKQARIDLYKVTQALSDSGELSYGPASLLFQGVDRVMASLELQVESIRHYWSGREVEAMRKESSQ